jgi:hypothetical protein
VGRALARIDEIQQRSSFDGRVIGQVVGEIDPVVDVTHAASSVTGEITSEAGPIELVYGTFDLASGEISSVRDEVEGVSPANKSVNGLSTYVSRACEDGGAWRKFPLRTALARGDPAGRAAKRAFPT